MNGNIGFENIKKARKAAGYTQKDLAELLHFEKSATISAWEKGKGTPSIETFLEMSKLLKCDVNYLLGLQEVPIKEYNEHGKYLGLSDTAINTLHSDSLKRGNYCSIISELLEELLSDLITDSSEGAGILYLLNQARQARKVEKEKILSDDMRREADILELKLWEALRDFTKGC